jgi:formate dehydrogenase major subunit
MAITRRDFLKISGITSAGVLFGVFDLKPIVAYAQANPPQWQYEYSSICCYCGVGCGIIVGSTWNGSDAYNPANEPYIQYVQGDPDHPINKGSLCSKGQGMAQLRNVNGALNPKRLTQPLKRDPAVDPYNWVPISWNDALNEIRDHIYTTRNTYMTGSEMIPQMSPPGKHKGPDNSANLIDAKGRDLYGLGVRLGDTIQNLTDGSEGAVTAFATTNKPNDTAVIGGGLSGGSDNDWDTNDEWVIKPGATFWSNRCTGIANLGGAAHDNEECYLLSKLTRALGLVYLEHQARI